jgi:cobalt/nickel transport system permease protein
MHVPDGYLSPATCAALYAAALPFWSIALRKVRALLMTRTVPLLSLSAAFSFVVMMFNIPLPGGTTGHAVGVAVAAIVLGPWAAILAISVALAIQALFFGDGGITAIGANCFNIAIAGSLVSHFVYRLGSGDAPAESRRRVIAAAVAGYLAINVAALLTAIEFGIQPMLFSAPDGTPLYAPYPLGIAVPAMMFGHLTFAGLAEAIVTGGIVAYLQRAEPSLLRIAPQRQERVRILRPMWVGLGILVVATPLGLLAAGTAWGEWSVEELGDRVPAGLRSLSSVWSAPVPDYAPSFVGSEAFGYALSGMFGVGLLALTVFLLQRWLGATR